MKNKRYALELLRKKVRGEEKITYTKITDLTGYSKRQLIRLSSQIEEKDIDSLLVHGNLGKDSNNSAPKKEVNYIVQFKNKYPEISISQFQDIYHEDIVWNPAFKSDVIKYSLKIRSYYFYEMLFRNQGWKSTIKHRKFGHKSESHPLRDATSRKGVLIIVDGTPFDWFQNGLKQSLHLAIDDATGEILAGWFMASECLIGYCYLLKLLITKHGIPENFYSDRYAVFYNKDDEELTQFGRMCEQLGINMIFANTPQAKGKVERWNLTIQNRLINDIKRYNIKSIEQLNKWFNSFYIKYLNKKFAYEPREKESLYIPLDKKRDLSLIFCRKENRTILNGNVISYDSTYYQIINHDGINYPMFKGTKVKLLIDIFDPTFIRIEYRNKVFNTQKIENKLTPAQKSMQTRIQNKKDREAALALRDLKFSKGDISKKV